QCWYSALTKWSNRAHGYSMMTLALVVVAAVSNGGGLILAAVVEKPEAVHLIASFAAGQAAGGMLLLYGNGSGLLRAWRLFSLRRLVDVLKSYWRFPAYTLPHSLASKAVPEIPVVMIGAFFGSATAGIYSVARRALNQPMYLLANNIGSVFHRQI